MKKTKLYAKSATEAALVGAMYVVLTVISASLGLSSGPIQFRLSEMLMLLPLFMPSAVLGLTVGCFISNILTGALIWDIIFGTLATLIGAVGAYLLRSLPRGLKWLASLPTILANSIIISLVLCYAYGAEGVFWLFVLTIFIGETVCAGLLGSMLYYSLSRTRIVK